MTNSIYQAAVSELESMLPPRVVSRSLKEGLTKVGKTPADVSYRDLEKILKSDIYRQLQVAMPVEQAKSKIKEVLAQLSSPSGTDDSTEPSVDAKSTLTQQAEVIDRLKEALRPFNLYFEWPETQKFRAQIQLLETEQEQQRNAGALIADARAQLQTLKQKLEDQLVSQSKALTELGDTLERVKSLGGPKVRRLESLIGQVRKAQDEHQLATAEVERARKLATDLRKLLESSVVGNPTKTEEGIIDLEGEDEGLLSIDTAGLTPEVNARLLMLDVESERVALGKLEQDFANLLTYQPEYKQQIAAYAEQLEAQQSISDILPGFRAQLEAAQAKLKQSLKQELSGIQAKIADANAPDQLKMQLQVSLGVLETTLPAESDVKQIHNLYTLFEQQRGEQEQAARRAAAEAEAKLSAQQETYDRLSEVLTRYEATAVARDSFAELQQRLEGLKVAQTAGQVDMDAQLAARQAAEQLETHIATQAQADIERERAQMRQLLRQLRTLPEIDVLATQRLQLEGVFKRDLQTLDQQTVGAASIQKAESALKQLKTEVRTHFLSHLDQLSKRAEQLSNVVMTQRLAEVKAQLEQDLYPDLATLGLEMQSAEENQRVEQIAELHQLEVEAQSFKGVENELTDLLAGVLTNARHTIEAGELTDQLDEGWSLLSRLRGEIEQRLSSFVPRLDKARQAFASVEVLNTDETAKVGLSLSHLNSQRDSFDRVSPGMQSKLESELREVEALLTSLTQQFEATRDVAGKLMSGNVIDDILGIFGEDSSPGPGPSQAAEVAATKEEKTEPSLTATQIRSSNDVLNQWLESYMSEQGISGAVTFNHQGEMISGHLEVDPGSLSQALQGFERDVDRLGEELNLGELKISTIEARGHIIVTAWPTLKYQVVLILNIPSTLSLVLNKLRRELPGISELMRGPAFT